MNLACIAQQFAETSRRQPPHLLPLHRRIQEITAAVVEKAATQNRCTPPLRAPLSVLALPDSAAALGPASKPADLRAWCL